MRAVIDGQTSTLPLESRALYDVIWDLVQSVLEQDTQRAPTGMEAGSNFVLKARSSPEKP
jgi:hypothetical protein